MARRIDTAPRDYQLPSLEDRLTPMIDALAAPMRDLRAAVGPGTATGEPAPEVLTALATAQSLTTETEAPQRDGLHALESTGTADAAVPALRTTATEVAATADRGTELSALLTDSHATQTRAAARLDRIIADFEAQAATLARTATTQADATRIVELARDALAEARTVTVAASAEMDDHTRRANALTDGLGGTNGTGVTVPPGYRSGPYYDGLGRGGPSLGMTDTELPDDPNLRAQVLLQRAALDAGVRLGEHALDAGVQIGAKIVDGIVDVVGEAITAGADVAKDAIGTVAAGADTAIGQHLGGEQAKPATPAGPAPAGEKPALFGGLGTGATAPAPTPPPSRAPEVTEDDPAPAPEPGGVLFGDPVPEPEPAPSPPAPSPAPEPAPAGPGGPAGGGVVPPPVRPPAEQPRSNPAPEHVQVGVVPEDDEPADDADGSGR